MADLQTVAFSVPGVVVALAAVVLAVRLGHGRTGDDGSVSPVLLVSALGLYVVLGWVVRPWVADAAVAFRLGVALLVVETIAHGWVWVVFGGLRGPPTRATARSDAMVWTVLGALVVTILFWPRAYVGHVGPLDGVPGLYRLDAGAGAIPWVMVMVGIRAAAVRWAVQAARMGDDGRARGPAVMLAVAASLFLLLFLVWLSNPVVIHFTGAPYLPGPVRFALPLVWTAILLGGVARHWWGERTSDSSTADTGAS